MKISTSNLLIILWTFVYDCTATNQCPQNLPDTILMKHHGNYCYQFVDEEKNWDNARDYCWRHGGWLVTVDSDDVQRFLVHSINHLTIWKDIHIWIGLNDKDVESQWKWVTADPNKHILLSWSKWHYDKPTSGFELNDCAHMVRNNNWHWSASPCRLWKSNRFICQYNEKLVQHSTSSVANTSLPKSLIYSSTVAEIDKIPNRIPDSDEKVSQYATSPKDIEMNHKIIQNINNHTDNQQTTPLESKESNTLIHERLGPAYAHLKEDSVFVVEAWHQNKYLLMMLTVCAFCLMCIAVVTIFVVFKRRQSKKTELSSIVLHSGVENPIWRGAPKRYTRKQSSKTKSSEMKSNKFKALPIDDRSNEETRPGNYYVITDSLPLQSNKSGSQSKLGTFEETEYMQPKECTQLCKCDGNCGLEHSSDVKDNLLYMTRSCDSVDPQEHIYESIDEYAKRPTTKF